MRKYSIDDVVIRRSQAKTLLARAKEKRERAKNAHQPKQHKRLTQPDKPVYVADANSKPYLLKSAKRSEEMAAKLTKQADKIAEILKEVQGYERGAA